MSLIKCTLCPHGCQLHDFQRGKCKVRVNKDGELYTLVYGKPCAVHVDPIEKKPIFHMLPGSRSFSIATAGCCFSCKYCQNWQISQSLPEETNNYDMGPASVISRALHYNCCSVAYTYSDPIIFYEYAYDTSILARKSGLRNILVTCGFINKNPLKELCKYTDAANVDLKGFTEKFYSDVTGGRLGPVLDALVIMKQEGVMVEVTNLVVPTLNDNMSNIKDMCKWIVLNLGANTPLHFSRFYPQYKLKNIPPTSIDFLREARNVAMEQGLRYVYLGNTSLVDAQHTYCYSCKKVVVGRAGYKIIEYNLNKGRCKFCGTYIYGLWD